MASPRLVTGATIRTSAPSPLSSTPGRWVRITSSYGVPCSVMRRAGSSVSTLPAAPGRTTELPLKSVIRNDTDTAPRCSWSMRATTSSDSTGAADSAASNVPARVIALPRLLPSAAGRETRPPFGRPTVTDSSIAHAQDFTEKDTEDVFRTRYPDRSRFTGPGLCPRGNSVRWLRGGWRCSAW